MWGGRRILTVLHRSSVPMSRLLLLALLLPAAAQAQAVLYVNAAATGAADGSSWADAFPDLQAALAEAAALAPPVEVWVAEGTYRPTAGTDRHASFVLQSGVALYGGFAGTEASLDERDWEAHPTVLSGDIGVPGDSLDNSYHVVVASGVDRTAVLDGFTITGGMADEAEMVLYWPGRRGGGLHAELGSPTIRRCHFVRNTTRWLMHSGSDTMGGGAYFSGGDPLLEDVVFRANTSGQHGAGLAQYGGHLTLRDVRFEDNQAGGAGGLYAKAARIDAAGIVFLRNNYGRAVGEYGGGAFIIEDPGFPEYGGVEHPAEEPAALLRDVVFEENWTGGVGSALTYFGDHLTVIGGRFVRNGLDPDHGGGRLTPAIDIEGWSRDRPGRPTLIGVLVAGNRGEGIEHVALRGVTVINSAFVGNRKAGMLLLQDAELVNVTVLANGQSAGSGPGGVEAHGEQVRLSNAILWGNEGAQMNAEGTYQNLVVEHALIGGGFEGVAVIDADPLFARPPSPGPDGRWGTDDDDYGDLALLPESPALDAGLDALLPPDTWDLDGDGDTEEPLPLDMAGRPRVWGEAVDLGAYEWGEMPVALESGAPAGGVLASIYPNPVRGAARLALHLERPERVRVEAFDLLGRRVAVLFDGVAQSGEEVRFDAGALAPGLYLVRALGETVRAERRVTVVR